MNEKYQNALDYLYGFANFEHKRIEQYSPENVSLDRPSLLLELLGNPQQRFPVVHIAGTKGKGSVAAMTVACLRAAGYRVGLYTSPHLQEFRDRIRILTTEDEDGRISETEVIAGVEQMKSAIEQVPGITWFELVTALAFLHFGQSDIDIAVVEVGLGGRLDATNVLRPLVSAITSISYDHTDLLGETLAEIAGEKAGIIKDKVPVVSAPQDPEAMARIEEVAHAHQAPLTIIGQDWLVQSGGTKSQTGQNGRQSIIITPPTKANLFTTPHEFALALAGSHQQQNASVAVAILDLIQPRFPKLSLKAAQQGLATVSWPGRLQMLRIGSATSPSVLVDCAHNVDSAQKLARALQQDYTYHHLWLVLGATADKDVSGILTTLLPLAEGSIMTTSGHPRAADPTYLLQLAAEIGCEAQAAETVSSAVLMAWQSAAAGDLICVTGSIFVVGDLLNQWDGLQSQLGS